MESDSRRWVQGSRQAPKRTSPDTRATLSLPKSSLNDPEEARSSKSFSERAESFVTAEMDIADHTVG